MRAGRDGISSPTADIYSVGTWPPALASVAVNATRIIFIHLVVFLMVRKSLTEPLRAPNEPGIGFETRGQLMDLFRRLIEM